MSDRWFIYKEGQALGPFTPEEIRQSLREGTFDPFDLVSRDGSSVRRELVEVDELFFTSKVIYGDDPMGAALNLAGAPATGASPAHFANAGATQAADAGGEGVSGNGLLALASSNRATIASQGAERVLAQQQKAPRKRRRDPKHFHVMDPRGRVLGPISAGEIQALFYKGVFDKDVKVMRDQSRAQVPVARFVAIYSESNRVKRAMQQGAHPMIQGGISPRHNLPLPRIAMGQPGSYVSKLAVLVIVAAMIFGGLAFYVYYRNSGINWSAKNYSTHVRKKPRKKFKPLPDSPRSTATRSRPQSQNVSSTQLKKRERLADLKRQRVKLLELKQRREARDRLKSKNGLAVKVAMPPPKKASPQAPKPLPAPAVPLTKTPPPQAPAKPQGQTIASLSDGQQVTKLGPMSFDKSVLADCDGACTMKFSGAGGTVKVGFFKQVWGPVLEGKTGGVYLSGLVKKNGSDVKIILSNVQ